MARILVVDDDRQLLDVLSLGLAEAGHIVRTAQDGLEALDFVEKSAPEVLVADVNMPRLDGFALCKRLREAGVAMPIILLTSRDNEIDEALGLELGADDYVTKPFSMRVLAARIAVLLRRDAVRAGSEPKTQALVAVQLSLDSERLEVRWAGAVVPFTLTEFRLLEAFARRPGIVLGRSRLLEIVRGEDSVVGERIVDVYVRRLRRKLEAVDRSFASIETVVGAGYRWVQP